jgi:Na+/H+ antiporter NhaD/arsenite permease-like protein
MYMTNFLRYALSTLISSQLNPQATAMMMVPNVMSIMNQIEAQPGARENPAAALKMSGG